MPYSVLFTRRAERDLHALNLAVQRRLSERIDRLAEDPFPPGCRKLQAGEPYFRIRVGGYRVIYQVEGKRLIVIIVKIGHRREVYR